MKDKLMMNLNLGCGSVTPDGWVNVDYGWGARFAKIPFFRQINKKIRLFNLEWGDNIFLQDLTKPFPWENNSVDTIYSSHTLEHLSRTEGIFFLKECYRVLRDRGTIRIVVPDLMSIVQQYVDKNVRADEFLEQLGVFTGSNGNSIKKRLAPIIHFPHKCMYDTATLIKVINEIGISVTSRRPFDSEISDIKEIELEDRTNNAVIVEGRK